MATSVHKTAIIETMDGTSILVAPLKIKYLRQFMESFAFMKDAPDDDIALTFMSECVRVAMQQFYPEIKSVSQVEESFDLATMRTVLQISAGINVDPEEEDIPKQARKDEEGLSWDKFDLVSLEAEVFSLGIWKDFDDLEQSLSLQELTAILEAKRDKDYEDKKFAAALQGVDLDEQSGKKEEDPWEAMKARVFSGGKANDSNDILAYQGVNANKAGFGIGMGLGYEDLRQKS
jgi:hypothetical protein